MKINDAFQYFAVSAGKISRGFGSGIVSAATSLTSFSSYVPEHLLSSPQDLFTPDFTLAREFYAGRYMLAGRIVETGGEGPFVRAEKIRGELSEWAHELHRFEWLRHFAGSNDPIASGHAVALVRKWIELYGGRNCEIAWDVETTARRLIAWQQNSVTLLAQRDIDFHQILMRSLGDHVRYLKRRDIIASSGLAQLVSVIAIAYAWATFAISGNSLAFAANRLNTELDRQIMRDGIHITRNPGINLDLLALLLPLRETLIATGKELPVSLNSAIERLLQGLRFFRMGDGSLSRFNGSGFVETNVLATIRRYADKQHNFSLNTTLGSYERLQLEDTIVVMDAGIPPKGRLSNSAHAGCLSFEFSAGQECIVINAGRPSSPSTTTSAVWRSTAAHSTAVFCETSSCRFENSRSGSGLINGQILRSFSKAESVRNENEYSICVDAYHTGYVYDFGAIHQRILRLENNGTRLRGRDRFCGANMENLEFSERDAVIIHFHLHPHISTSIAQNTSILLNTHSGRTWCFECDKINPRIEESIFFATIGRPVKTKQITLNFRASEIADLSWSFTCLDTM